MMREIKFRAWDKKNKIMRLVITLFNKLHLDFCQYATGQSSDSIVNLYYDECEIMQFTGMKDKTGKEIYEGDIVNCEDGNHDLFTGVIQWDKMGARFMIYDELNKEKFAFDYDTDSESTWLIGNIYENPNFLLNLNGGKK